MAQKITEELEQELHRAHSPEDFIRENAAELQQFTLAEFLEHLLTEKHLVKAEVIGRSCLETAYAYHIFAGLKKSPSRAKMMSIALAMDLSVNEAQHLLYYAGQKRLYARASWDSILIYALENHLSVMQTNELIEKLAETPLLGNIIE